MPLQTISTITIPPTTTMSAHVVASNPHPQYLLASNLASAAKLQIKLNGLVDVNYTSAADGDILVHSGATWSLTNLNSIISGLTIYPATISTYGTVILATYPDISNNVSSTVITPNLISSYVSMVSTNIHREFSTAIDTSITNIPYATTTTSGRIRLATQAEANSSNFENADIVPAITPNVMRTYTSNYVSTYHGSYLQNMLRAGTGIYIDPSSVSTGSTVYNGIRVSDVPISEVVDLGTSLTTISTSLVNLDTSKQLLLARSGNYTSVITSVINQNTDSETNVDTVHCTIPYATTSAPGIVTLTNEITESNKNDSTTAVTPNALVNAVGELTGMCNVIWRHVGKGYYTSRYIQNVAAADTSGYYKLTTFLAGASYGFDTATSNSLCLAIAWGKTIPIQVTSTCMFDIDIRPSGMCKMEQVIAPILNVECYGGPEYYAVDATELKAANDKYRQGGVNYDNIRYGGTATQIANDFNGSSGRKGWAVDINNSTADGNYVKLPHSRLVVSGKGLVQNVVADSNTKAFIQTYECDNVVVQYGAAIHERREGVTDDAGLNPVTHLRTIINKINVTRQPTICIHWCILGLAPIASAIWDGTNYNTYNGTYTPITVTLTKTEDNGAYTWDPVGSPVETNYAADIDLWIPEDNEYKFTVTLPKACTWKRFSFYNHGDRKHPRSVKIVECIIYRTPNIESTITSPDVLNSFEYQIKGLVLAGHVQHGPSLYVYLEELYIKYAGTKDSEGHCDLYIDYDKSKITYSDNFSYFSNNWNCKSMLWVSTSSGTKYTPEFIKFTHDGTDRWQDGEGCPSLVYGNDSCVDLTHGDYYKVGTNPGPVAGADQHPNDDVHNRLGLLIGYSNSKIYFAVLAQGADFASESVDAGVLFNNASTFATDVTAQLVEIVQ